MVKEQPPKRARSATATSRGPRTTRDPEGTRRRIVAAALTEFSAKGIDGARVDAIAAKAGVNKRMLYYYFGSKDGLYREVLRNRLADRAPDDAAAHRAGDRRLAELQDRLARAPEYIRLLTWEALERGSRRRVEEEDRRREPLERWIADVRAAQEAGRLDPDLDPAQLVLSELALVLFPLAFPQVTRLVTGRSPHDAGFLEDRRDFLIRLAASVDAR